MKLQYLRAFIVLLAGLITLIINIRTGRDITISLLIVLIVILIFYFIGTLSVELIQKSIDNGGNSSNSNSEDNIDKNDDLNNDSSEEEFVDDDNNEALDYNSETEEEF